LGGTLRLFLEKREVGRYYFNRNGREGRESRIAIFGMMEMGSSKEMTDKLASELESFLSKYEEVDQYITDIIGSNINMTIEFEESFKYDYAALKINNEVV